MVDIRAVLCKPWHSKWRTRTRVDISKIDTFDVSDKLFEKKKVGISTAIVLVYSFIHPHHQTNDTLHTNSRTIRKLARD